MSSDEVMASINEKLSILLREREEMKDILFGDDGMIDSVKLIKAELVGNPEFKKEGLIVMVSRHNDLYKKIQNLTTFSLAMLSIGSAAGVAISWIASHWNKIKSFFS